MESIFEKIENLKVDEDKILKSSSIICKNNTK